MKNLNLVQLDVQKLHIDEMKALNGGVAPALLVGGGAVGVSVAGGGGAVTLAVIIALGAILTVVIIPAAAAAMVVGAIFSDPK